MIRKLSTLALSLSAVVLMASPAAARPVLDPSEPGYYGPGVGSSAHRFANVNAHGCADTYRVYGEPKKVC